MSKNTRKCPNCGATVPADMKYCRKCHARLDSGRVETLPKESKKDQRSSRDDALRNLPRPVRPEEDAATTSRGDGFFTPEEAANEGRVRPERQGRMGMADDRTPRPTETARGGKSPDRGGQKSDRRMWQIAAVLAVILVIIVVAVVLVIKLNGPATPPEPSQSFETPVPTTEPTATAAPTATPRPSPTPTAVPAVTPNIQQIAPPPATIQPSATPTNTPTSGVTDVYDTVYINGVGVNIRSGPGTSYSAIGSESTGYQLQRTGRTNTGWSRVQYNGGTAYVSESFLTTTKPAAATNPPNINATEASGTVKVAVDIGANLRSGPGTNYSVMATVAKGTELTRTGVSGDWTRVSYNGQTLYVSTGLLESGSGTTSGGTTTTTGTVTCNTPSGVNIRSGPGTGYSKLGLLTNGQSLTCTGQSGDWYQVSYNGQTGYVSAAYVTKN